MANGGRSEQGQSPTTRNSAANRQQAPAARGIRRSTRSQYAASPQARRRPSAGSGASSRTQGAQGSASGALAAVLANSTARVVIIALIAALMLLFAALTISRCNPSAAADEAQPAQEQAATEQNNSINADIPEELRWRDQEFALDPERTTWKSRDNNRKVVYLTIDDGPSEITEKFLDLFDELDCKATFFVTGHDPNYYHLIHEAYKRGHTIGLHTMTHEYDEVYASEEAYFADLDAIGQVVKEQIGYVPCFIRFPGGSSNGISAEYSPGLMTKLVGKVQALGYQYWDWNLSSGDGEVHSAEELISMSTNNGLSADEAEAALEINIMILCHDSATKQSTLDALPSIIKYYKDRGYSFEAMDRDTFVCHHGVTN